MTAPTNSLLLSVCRSTWLSLPATSHISRITNSRHFTKNHDSKTPPPGCASQRRSYIRSPSRSSKTPTCPYDPISMPIEEKAEATEARSMMELPGPTGWPVVGNFLTYVTKKNKGKMHLIQASFHKKYGKIFRERWGPNWQVHVSDPRLMEEIHRQEGRYPNRPCLQSWLLYRQLHRMPYGLTTAQGPEWQLYRTEFGKKVFCPQGIKTLVEPINQISDDLVSKLRDIYHQKGPSSIAPGLPSAAYLWSLEAVGSFLFETRLGCLKPNIPTRTQVFLDNLIEMMASSLYLIVGEKLHQKLNTSYWQRHSNSWDQVFKIGKELIDEKMEALDKKETSTGLYLSYLLNNPNLTKDQIYTNITELLMAGSDTTANTLCFALYLLANNPDKQQKLRNELTNVVKPSTTTPNSSSSSSSSPLQITNEHLPKLKYLKMVLKETMRIFPVVTMNCRILENDIILDGYKIPKQTLFVMNQFSSSMDPDYFYQPLQFIPERWQRNKSPSDNDPFNDEEDTNDNNYVDESTGRQSKRHPFACIPFGFGSRSCVGKHVGNLELMVSIAKILDSFHLEPIKGEPLETSLRTLLNPGERIPVTLVPRK